MSTVRDTILMICVTLIATELIAKLCPKNSMTNFVRALISVLLFASALAAFSSFDLDLTAGTNQLENREAELTEYMNEQYTTVVEKETAEYISGLLQTIDIEIKEIHVSTDIDEESSILIEKVTVYVKYETDRERALALLNNTVGKEIAAEVKYIG